MAGTRLGGLKAARTNKKLYGDGTNKKNFYSIIGHLGGVMAYQRNTVARGFARNIELAREAGKKGGSLSKRGRTVSV